MGDDLTSGQVISIENICWFISKVVKQSRKLQKAKNKWPIERAQFYLSLTLTEKGPPHEGTKMF